MDLIGASSYSHARSVKIPLIIVNYRNWSTYIILANTKTPQLKKFPPTLLLGNYCRRDFFRGLRGFYTFSISGWFGCQKRETEVTRKQAARKSKKSETERSQRREGGLSISIFVGRNYLPKCGWLLGSDSCLRLSLELSLLGWQLFFLFMLIYFIQFDLLHALLLSQKVSHFLVKCIPRIFCTLPLFWVQLHFEISLAVCIS